MDFDFALKHSSTQAKFDMGISGSEADDEQVLAVGNVQDGENGLPIGFLDDIEKYSEDDNLFDDFE
jgi:hypothetical protein